jgi:hypothetical protein
VTGVSRPVQQAQSNFFDFAGGPKETKRMKHTVSHDLGRDGAKKVAEAAWGSYSARFSNYNPTCEWQTPYLANIGFKVKGIALKGALDVGEKGIDLDLDVPFLLRPFKGQALQVIEEEIRRWIAKSKAGEI